MANFITVALEERRLRRAAEARKRAYFDAALAFNRIHTYNGFAGQWMCPTCHKIHGQLDPFDPMAFFLTRRQFPACCEFPQGHRLNFANKAYATDTNWKLP